MEPLTRRRFVGASIGAAAAASVLPPMLRQAVANASEKPGSLSQIEHIVVLMQENRSFDHYFGSLPGVRGFGDKDVLTLPAGNNAATGLPWAPATDGLRNITGRVNRNGTVTIWAITSTVSGAGDQGADPNKLVAITDRLSATAPATAAGESFRTVKAAGFGEVLRGVSFTPGTRTEGGR